MTDGQKPHNKPQYGEVMHHSLMLYSLLSHCCCCCCCRRRCCRCCLSTRLLFPSSEEYIQYFTLALSSQMVMFLVEPMSFPSKLVMTPVSYTSSSSTLLLHAQERGDRGYLYSRSCGVNNLPEGWLQIPFVAWETYCHGTQKSKKDACFFFMFVVCEYK